MGSEDVELSPGFRKLLVRKGYRHLHLQGPGVRPQEYGHSHPRELWEPFPVRLWKGSLLPGRASEV